MRRIAHAGSAEYSCSLRDNPGCLRNAASPHSLFSPQPVNKVNKAAAARKGKGVDSWRDVQYRVKTAKCKQQNEPAEG